LWIITIIIIIQQTYLNALDERLASHAHYTSRKLKPSDKSLEFHQDFRVTHYAGDVTYEVDGFVEKNRDTLYQDFKRLVYSR
jgi:myosin-1